MKCKYEGSGVWECRCIGTREVDPCKGYEKCKSYRPDYQTNADRIRGMSDEELCFLFVNTERFANLINVSYAEMMDWLRMPAEGEQHGKND